MPRYHTQNFLFKPRSLSYSASSENLIARWWQTKDERSRQTLLPGGNTCVKICMMGIITSLLMTLNRLSADLSGSFQIGESCAERAGPIPDPRPPTSQPDVSMDMNIRVSGFPPSLMAVAACVLLAIVATGCSTGPQIRSATAPGADLGNDFRTFGFFPELSTDRAGLHTIVSRELVSATRREMEVRGFTFVENSAKADLLINFHTDVSDQFRVRSTPHYWHGSSFWNHRRGFYDPWFGHHRWPSHS